MISARRNLIIADYTENTRVACEVREPKITVLECTMSKMVDFIEFLARFYTKIIFRTTIEISREFRMFALTRSLFDTSG